MKKIILLLLLLSNILYGQDSLSLMDAIKIGLWKNYDIQISTKKQNINKINNSYFTYFHECLSKN